MHCRGHLVRIPKSATVMLESLAPGTNPFQVVQALILLETVASNLNFSLNNLRDLCDIALPRIKPYQLLFESIHSSHSWASVGGPLTANSLSQPLRAKSQWELQNQRLVMCACEKEPGI